MPTLDASAMLDDLHRPLWVVTAATPDGRRGGCIATFVIGISLVPELPRACIALARHHQTREFVEASNAFALHRLDERHLEWVWRFGIDSGRDVDKLSGVDSHVGVTGSPILTAALDWMDCRVETRCETGDRTIYVAEVVDVSRPGAEPPLTVSRMLQIAPPDRLARLDELLRRDRVTDAAAILDWRRARTSGPI